ncbi:MAG: hypothetical protein JW830_02745 [Bacteroidales bacterium]|nr:hypothetical protein [Bacteroidales bacterium]
MKKIGLTMTIAVLLLICANGILAQTAQTQLNQVELIQQFLGTWNCDINKDTVEVWECIPYGKTHTTTVSQIIKGKKSDLYLNNAGFDKRDGKFKGLLLYPNGDYYTWIGLFTTDKKLSVDIVDNLNPEKVLAKYEFEFKTPTNRTMTQFTADGVKVGEFKFIKVK